MTLLAEHICTTTPGRRVVEVYDADAYLGDAGALAAARRKVVAGDGYHLYLLSLQPVMAVQVVVRVWDTPPVPPGDAEGHTAVSLESETGILVIGRLDHGPAGEIALPRPGVYEGHAWWQGRRAAADHYGAALRRIAGDSTADAPAGAWGDRPVTERYVLDLAWTRAPEPLDEDDL
ncbi:hypothetical protein [Streptomyces glaucus]|uniref:Uncharacterized protein n=1 Tax=Streptomyces glaucus TaxID=284029 RepID=A0ABP5W4Y7_9ACTN